MDESRGISAIHGNFRRTSFSGRNRGLSEFYVTAFRITYRLGDPRILARPASVATRQAVKVPALRDPVINRGIPESFQNRATHG